MVQRWLTYRRRWAIGDLFLDAYGVQTPVNAVMVMLGRSNASPLRVSDGPAVRRVGRRPAILAGVADLGIRDMLGRGSEWYR